MIVRKRLSNIGFIIFITGLFSACQAFSSEDTVGTLEAQNLAYATQGIEIQTEVFMAETEVMQVVRTAQTEVARQNGINNVLLATVSAGSTPTIAIVPAPRQHSTLNPPITNDGTTQFQLTGVAPAVYGTDGCAIDPQGSFPVGIQRVYATLQAFNVSQGVFMEAEWFRGGESVWTDSWTVDANYDQICIWFFLLPSYVPFSDGVWSVQLRADGVPIQQPMTFAFTSTDDMMDDG